MPAHTKVYLKNSYFSIVIDSVVVAAAAVVLLLLLLLMRGVYEGKRHNFQGYSVHQSWALGMEVSLSALCSKYFYPTSYLSSPAQHMPNFK